MENSGPHKTVHFISVHLFWQESSSSYQYLPVCFASLLYPLISHLKSYWHLHIAAIPSDIEDRNEHLTFLFLPMMFFPDSFQIYCIPRTEKLENM